AIRVVADADLQAAPTGAEEETLDLGRQVEFVLGPVADVHLQIARLQLVNVDHLDGVVLDDLLQPLVGVAENRFDHLADGELDESAVELGDDLVAGSDLRPPAPVVGVEWGEVAALLVQPAQVQRRKAGDQGADLFPVLDWVAEGAIATHEKSRRDVGLALRSNGEVAEGEAEDVVHHVVLEAAYAAVDVEAARLGVTRLALQAAV